jgi:hypothetical protein
MELQVDNVQTEQAHQYNNFLTVYVWVFANPTLCDALLRSTLGSMFGPTAVLRVLIPCIWQTVRSFENQQRLRRSLFPVLYPHHSYIGYSHGPALMCNLPTSLKESRTIFRIQPRHRKTR